MFASAEKRRAIYERLAVILPDDAFVSQHRSILERELGNAELAVKFAREAVKRNPLNQPFLNTLGLALELESRTADRLKSQVLLFEAGKIFDENVRYEPASPFGYVGKANILRGKLDNERTQEGKAAVLTEAVAMLEEASELSGESPMITGELAWFRRKLGDLGDVVNLVKEGVRKNPADVRLRRMLVQFERDAGNVREAAATGIAGIQYAPTSWLLYRDVARLKRQLNDQTHVVKSFFESAIRHNKGDIALMIELGSFLFVRGNYIEYQKVFRDVDLLQIPGHEKTRIRERLRAGSSLKSFAGKVKVLKGSNVYVAADSEGGDIFFWRSDAHSSILREGQRVSFHLGFNSKGAIAFDVEAIQN